MRRRVCILALLGCALTWMASGASLLGHRWSFNGSFDDAITGTAPVATNGWSFVTVGSGQAVKLAGGKQGTSCISLGANMLNRTGKGATIEAWCRYDTARTYQRLYDFGKSLNDNFLCFSFSGGVATNAFSGVKYYGVYNYISGAHVGIFTTGTFYHVAVTYEPNADGTWTVRIFQRDGTTGALLNAVAYQTPPRWSLAGADQTYCRLGRAFGSDYDTSMTLNEFRIWNRALTDQELAVSASWGPDATIPDGDTPFGLTPLDALEADVALAEALPGEKILDKYGDKALVSSTTQTENRAIVVHDGELRVNGGRLTVAAQMPALGGQVGDHGKITVEKGAVLTASGIRGSAGSTSTLVLDGGTLELRGASVPGKRLLHRWSFNGDLNDSLSNGVTVAGNGITWVTNACGGKAAKLCGGASGSKASWIDLGPEMLPRDGSSVTIELWARQDATRNWSRIYDIGKDKNDYLTFTWTRDGDLKSDYLSVKYKGTQIGQSNQLAPYTLGVMYHLAVVYENLGDGTWKVTAYRQDATTGETIKSTSLTPPTGWSPAVARQEHFYLGYDVQNGPSSAATYDEVRVWAGALTEAELSAQAVAGPDAGFSDIAGVTSLMVGSRGATIDTTNDVATVQAALTSDRPLHRWSLNGTLVDSITGVTATGSAGVTWVTNAVGRISARLCGGKSGSKASYVNLGTDLLPRDGSSVTIELWARQDATWSWSRIYDIGKDGNDYMTFTWTRDGGINSDYVSVKYKGTQVGQSSQLAPYTLGVMYHLAVVYENLGNGTWKVTAYRQDATTGETLKSTFLTPPAGWSLRNAYQTYFYLGCDVQNGTSAAATYDEVRVWGRALSEAELTANALLGPDVLPASSVLKKTGPGTLALCEAGDFSGELQIECGELAFLVGDAVGTNATINLASGTTWCLTGRQATVGRLVGGDATVVGGDLSVMDAVCASGTLTLAGTRITGTVEFGTGKIVYTDGAFDLSGIRLRMTKKTRQSQVLMECAEGFSGELASVEIPSSLHLQQTATHLRVAPFATVITIR